MDSSSTILVVFDAMEAYRLIWSLIFPTGCYSFFFPILFFCEWKLFLLAFELGISTGFSISTLFFHIQQWWQWWGTRIKITFYPAPTTG
jgi:hypothetical protein